MTQAELAGRLERLERYNRRLKRVVLAALVLLGSAVALGAAYATRAVPQKIVAHQFEIVDGAGKARIKMSVDEPKDAASTAEVSMFDSEGKELVELSALDNGFENLAFLAPDGNLDLHISGYGQAWGSKLVSSSEIDLYGGPAVGPLGMTPTGIGTQQMTLRVSGKGQPTISLADGQGFKMDLGSTQIATPRTGETHQTSAASVVMFGNDKKHSVVWQAPQ